MSKAVAKSGGNGKEVTLPPIDFEADAGAGSEGLDQDDIAIPAIAVLQALSPQVNKAEGAYVEGAEAGDIYVNVGDRLMEGEVGIRVVPIAYRRCYIEWILREEGAGSAGFVADHGNMVEVLENTKKDERGRNITPDGTEIVQTAEYVVFIIDENNNHSPAVLRMNRTQLKKARAWNAVMAQLIIDHPTKPGVKFNPAWFYRTYKMTTVPESNAKGNWFGWRITPAEFTLELPGGDQIYLAAREWREKFIAGEIKTAPPVAEESDATDADVM